MPSAPFRIPQEVREVKIPQTEGEGCPRGETSFELGLLPSANESWEIHGLNFSFEVVYSASFNYVSEFGFAQLEEQKTARKKAYEAAKEGRVFAEKAVAKTESALTEAKNVFTEAKLQNEAEPSHLHAKEFFEAGEKVFLAEQTVENARTAREEAKKTEEQTLEELHAVERELSERGVTQALELAKAGALTSLFIEFGPIGEPIAIIDCVEHRALSMPFGWGKVSKEKATVTAAIDEVINQRADLATPSHLGERGKVQFTIVAVIPPRNKQYGPEFAGNVATLSIVLKSVSCHYETTLLSELRREPRGPRPGR